MRLLPGILVAAVLASAALAISAPADASPGAGPVASERPNVAGSPTQGARLLASPGTWTGAGKITLAYQWYRCDTMGARCTALRGVTKRSRRIGPTDVGRTLSLEVRATDSRGTTTAHAGLVGPIAGTPAALGLKAQPSVAGDSVLGATVRVEPGRWQPQPTGFSFQWARCNLAGRACAPIAGATTETHEIATADLGHRLLAIVQARSQASVRAVFSVATPPAAARPGQIGPSTTTAPLVATVVQQGRKLVGATGTWFGAGAIRYAYQWSRCDAAGAHCQAIRGATAASYTPVAKDVGATLGFSVRGTDATGARTAYASLVGPVAGADAGLASAGQPTVAGNPTQGQTLQVSPGAWTLPTGAFAYRWLRCNENGRACAAIAGATAAAYIPAAEDVGHALVAVVRATVGEATQDAVSAATRPIVSAPGPASTSPPTISGPLQHGKQLTGFAGTWVGSGAIAYAYQWYRCDPSGAHCKAVHGATRATYTQARRDVGQTLAVAVRASDPTGTTTSYTGIAGPIAAANAPLVATSQPAVAGTPAPGQTLTATNGGWSPNPTAFAYQWLRCNPNGRLCAPIPGATASSYAATPADAGRGLVLSIRASLTGAEAATLSTTVRIA